MISTLEDFKSQASRQRTPSNSSLIAKFQHTHHHSFVQASTSSTLSPAQHAASAGELLWHTKFHIIHMLNISIHHTAGCMQVQFHIVHSAPLFNTLHAGRQHSVHHPFHASAGQFHTAAFTVQHSILAAGFFICTQSFNSSAPLTHMQPSTLSK